MSKTRSSCFVRDSKHLESIVGGLQPFQVKGHSYSISWRWRKWKKAFELYELGKGMTSDSQKRGLLLHTADLEVQEVF